MKTQLRSHWAYIERTTAAAISGVLPDAWSWGKLAAVEFLTILTDVTTWSLTHFEPVRSWSVAEDLTPTEEQEGYGLIGRVRRMSASEYGGSRITRTLRDVSNPKVRAAALWTAHALLATCHIAASDRASGEIDAGSPNHFAFYRSARGPPMAGAKAGIVAAGVPPRAVD